MKKRTFLTVMMLLGITLSALAAKPQSPREQLLQRLQKIQKKGYMYGHQDDPFYGLTWEYEAGRSDTKDLVGDYPGVMGFDLGGIEVGDQKNLDSVPFNLMKKEIIAHHERGGIVTISWHPRNPLIGTTAWCQQDTILYNKALEYYKFIGKKATDDVLPNPKHTVRSIIPGGEKHDLFMLWLQRVASFMGELKDSKGNPVPVIFRPWHEYNGSWFWWGEQNCTAEEYKTLWNMTQDYLNQQLPGQLVWSNSPNLSGWHTMEHFLQRWPGDARVDILGEDAYQWGSEKDFIMQFDSDMKFLSSYAQEHGLLFAVTECGIQNSPEPTWWTRVFKPVVDRYPIVYFLPWRNYKGEHFGAAIGLKTEADFLKLAKEKNCLFLNDIKKVK